MPAPDMHDPFCGAGTCPLPATHRRLRDAHQLWHNAADHYHDPDGFRRYLNSTIEALRNVTWMLQSEKAAIPGFDDWYAGWQDRMRRDPILTWLKDARNTVVKRGDLETASTGWASILTSWNEHQFAQRQPLPPYASIQEFTRSLGAALLPLMPPALRNEAVLVLERRWEVPDLPGHELLDALAHAFGVLADLVREAHQRCGADFELFAADATGARHVPTDHLDGRFPCMVTTRETRSARVNLRTGEVYPPMEITPRKSTAAEAVEAERRYKLREVNRPASTDVFALAEMWGEAARRMLRRDRYLVPVLFLVRSGELVQQSALTFDDQQQKVIVWQHIADDVRRTGADGLVFIAETWLLRGDAATRGVRPSEARRREEAIQIFAAKSTGEVRSVIVPFSRGLLGKIKLEDANEMEGTPNFFAPVRAVWSGSDGLGGHPRPLAVGVPDAAGDTRPKT